MTYEEMYIDFQEGKVSAQEWYDFCYKILDQILEENKEVFERLKYR